MASPESASEPISASSSDTSTAKVTRAKRSRASAPKVRTGCVVCKIRRVKCDETKPACVRCTSTGRKCDGYETAKPLRAAEKRLAGSARPSKSPTASPPRSSSVTVIWKQPSSSITGTDREMRGFHFFRSLTAAALAEGIGNVNWVQFVMQAAHSNETVKQSAAALGALSERFHVHAVLASDDERVKARDGMALAQYSKALQTFRTIMNEDSQQAIESTLTTCFLLLAFEFFQGNTKSSFVHLANGIRILYRYLARLQRESEVPAHSASTRELLQIYSLVDMQSSIWTSSTNVFMSTLIARSEGIPPGVPTPLSLARPYTPYEDPTEEDYFHCFIQGNATMARNFVMCFHFLREASVHRDESLPELYPAWVLKEREVVLGRTIQWTGAMESFIKRHGRLTKLEQLQKAVWTVNHYATLLKLQASLQLDESVVYRTLTPTFKKILEISKPLLLPVNVMIKSNVTHVSNVDPSVRPYPMFSFIAGLIEPLYFTAVKCHDLDIASEAVSLLETRPWREGAWDSSAMAKLARKKMESLEQVDAYGLLIPEFLKRVHPSFRSGEAVSRFSTAAEVPLRTRRE